jgi:integrase/recombinase XerC
MTKGDGMQVREARERYIRWLSTTRDVSPHTIRAYDGDIAAFEKHLGPRAIVEQIDADALLGFVEHQRAAGLASKSIRRRASGLRGFCAWLLSARFLRADPWAGVTLSLGRSRKLPRPVATSDLDRLFTSLCERAGVDRKSVTDGTLTKPREATTLLAVALMVATGLRVSEVVSVRSRDIDLPGRNLRVLGKGLRERQVFLTNDWISSLATAYLTTRSSLGVEHDRLLFNSHRAPLTTAAMRSRLMKAGIDAGLARRVTPHMLRHTAATQLIEAGVDIRYVQRLLGHASLSTTEIYTHVSDHALKHMVSAADVLGRSFARDN